MAKLNILDENVKLVDLDGLSIFWGKVQDYIIASHAAINNKIGKFTNGTPATGICKVIEDNEKVTASALTDLDTRVTGNASEIAKIQSELDALSGGNGSIATQINNAINALNLPNTYLKIADGKITMTESAGTGNILKTYTFKQGDTTIGSINLAKDLVVTSGSIVVDNGVNCLELVLSSGDVVHIPLSDLVDEVAVENAINAKLESISLATESDILAIFG